MPDALMPKVDGHWLVYRQSYESTMRKGAASKAITEYLEAIGYEQIQISPTLVFKRGFGLASLFHFNPKRMYSEVSVDFASVGEQTIVELILRINRFGNMPLKADYDFWAAELDALQRTVQGQQFETNFSDFAAERAYLYNINILLGFILIALALFSGFLMFLLLTAV